MRPTVHVSACAATVALLAAAVITMLPVSALATIIHVPVDQTTIAAGIAAASPGDTVMIACDTYYEHGLLISSAITLMGHTGGWECVTIDGNATDTILNLTDADGAVVRGITFTNGAALSGAGVYVDSCDVVFRDCKFYNNNAEVEGGGLRYRYGNPDITYCDFISNSAADRGGNLALTGTGGSVSSCNINGGSAEWGGGACARLEATTEFDHCYFSGNYAPSDEGYGGGLYIGNSAGPMLQWCTFSENTAQWGGGLFARDPVTGPLPSAPSLATRRSTAVAWRRTSARPPRSLPAARSY